MSTELVEHKKSPEDLLAECVANGADPVAIKTLSDLAERWADREAERQFNESMHAAQEEMPTVIRDATNPKTHSKYAKLETVLRECKPVAQKHGFSLSYGEASCDIEKHKKTVLDVRHVGGHVEKYELILPVDGIGPQGNPIGGMNAVQGAVSTMSYAKRVLFCQVFNISIADSDNDGTSQTQTIDETELKALEELLMESGADIAKFCKAYQIEKVADLPAAQLGQARAQVLRKMNQKP